MRTFGEEIRRCLAQASISKRKVDELSRSHAHAAHEPNLHISRYRLHELIEDGSDIKLAEMFELARLCNRPVAYFTSRYLACYQEMLKEVDLTAGTNLLESDQVQAIFRTLPEPAPSTGLLPLFAGLPEHPSLSALWPPGPHFRYGTIGLKDLTMWPLLPPGTLVRVNTRQRSIAPRSSWKNPYLRPIYFLEIRDGFACGWCDVDDRHLVLVPHDHSPVSSRPFRLGVDVDVRGRVVGQLIDHELLKRLNIDLAAKT